MALSTVIVAINARFLKIGDVKRSLPGN